MICVRCCTRLSIAGSTGPEIDAGVTTVDVGIIAGPIGRGTGETAGVPGPPDELELTMRITRAVESLISPGPNGVVGNGGKVVCVTAVGGVLTSRPPPPPALEKTGSTTPVGTGDTLASVEPGGTTGAVAAAAGAPRPASMPWPPLALRMPPADSMEY